MSSRSTLAFRKALQELRRGLSRARFPDIDGLQEHAMVRLGRGLPTGKQLYHAIAALLLYPGESFEIAMSVVARLSIVEIEAELRTQLTRELRAEVKWGSYSRFIDAECLS